MSTICPSCGNKNLEGLDECAECGVDLRTVDLPKPVSMVEQSVMYLPLTALTLTQVHSVPPETTVEAAIHTLNRQKLDILEVVEHGQLIGVLSVRDIVMRVGTEYASKMQLPVREMMTPNPETLPPDAPIAYAINKMDVGGYRHVPVVQDGRMIGVASAGDVIRHLFKHSKESVVTAGRTTSHGAEGKPG